MGRTVDALRADLRISGRPTWRYGLMGMLVVSVPLFLGIFLGHLLEGAAMALGGYFTMFGDAPGHPYGERVRRLLITAIAVTLGTGFGTFIRSYPWPVAVVLVGLVVTASMYWQALGVPTMLAMIVAYFGSSRLDVLPHLVATACGGLLVVLLVVAIWPLYRLRPLRRAVEEAGAALADLLTGGGRAPLSDEDWESLRDQAGAALANLDKSLSLYRISEDDGQSPERLSATLARLLRQAIELHVLRAAAMRTDIGVDWTRELDEAVGLLADALREAITLGGSTKMPEALAAAGRFADRVREIREIARAGHVPLPEAALLGQVNRCVDRIAMTVRSVKQQAAEGVEVGPRLPKFVRFGKPVTTADRHPVQGGLAVTLAMTLMLAVHEYYARWFVVTVAVGLRPTYRDTVDRVLLRTLGTAVGAVAAAAVLAVSPERLYLAGFISVCAAAGFSLRGSSYGYWMILATPITLVLADFALPLDWSAAGVRVVLTLTGGVMALCFAWLLWPRAHQAELNAQIAELLDRHAALVRALADRGSDEVRARISEASEAAEKLTGSLDNLDKEPRGGAPQRLREAVTAAARLRDNALTLSAIPSPGNEPDPTTTVLDLVVDRLEAAAEEIRTGRPGTPPDDLDRVLDGVGTYVNELAARRQDELAGGAGEAMTSLRRNIRYAAAARPALRGLSTEAVRLASLTLPRRRQPLPDGAKDGGNGFRAR